MRRIFKDWGRLATAAAAAAALTSAPAAAQAVYSFGDSLSDTGNVNSLSLGLFGGDEYFEGRFSNGFLWNDYLTALSAGVEQRVNPGLVGPFFEVTADGYNFAHGGSVAGPLSSNVDTSFFGGSLGALSNLPAFRTTDQAFHFRDQTVFGTRAFEVRPNDFATISVGGNDYFNGETDVNRVVGNLFTAIDAIKDGGLRNIIVLDVPNIGDTPRSFGTAEGAALNALSDAHNSLIAEAAAQYEAANPGVLIAIVPASRLFTEVLDDAANNGGAFFGFTIATPGPGTSGHCLGDGLVLSACPDTYLFYDDIHPTARAHAITAQGTVATVRAKLAAQAQNLTRSQAVSQTSASDGRVVSARIAALRLGATGSGFLTSGLQSKASQHSFGGLGFQTTGAAPVGAVKASAFRFADGESRDAYDLRQANPFAQFDDTPTLEFGEGERIETFGIDYLWSPNFAFGGVFTEARFDRRYFDTQHEDYAKAMTVYGAWFDGPWTMTLRARAGRSDQAFVQATGFQYDPFITGRAESRFSSLRIDAERTIALGPATVTMLTRTAYGQTRHDGYQQESRLGFFDQNSTTERLEGYAGFASAKLEAPLKMFGAEKSFISLETGGVASSSRDMGFSPVIDDMSLVREELIETSLFSPYGDSPDQGLYGSASLRLSPFDGLIVDARAAAIAAPERTWSVLQLNASFQF